MRVSCLLKGLLVELPGEILAKADGRRFWLLSAPFLQQPGLDGVAFCCREVWAGDALGHLEAVADRPVGFSVFCHVPCAGDLVFGDGLVCFEGFGAGGGGDGECGALFGAPVAVPLLLVEALALDGRVCCEWGFAVAAAHVGPFLGEGFECKGDGILGRDVCARG